jgi:hypothetical protein
MARARYNGKKGLKEENICYVSGCHHNRDKKRIIWKQGIHKSNKSAD